MSVATDAPDPSVTASCSVPLATSPTPLSIFNAATRPLVSFATVIERPEPAVLFVNVIFSLDASYTAVTPAADALIFANTELIESDAATVIDVPLIDNDPADTADSRFALSIPVPLNAFDAFTETAPAANASMSTVSPELNVPPENDTDNPFAIAFDTPSEFVNDATVLPARSVTVTASVPDVVDPAVNFNAATSPLVSPETEIERPEPAVLFVNTTFSFALSHDAVTSAAELLMRETIELIESDVATVIVAPLIVKDPALTADSRFAESIPVPLKAFESFADTAPDFIRSTENVSPDVSEPDPNATDNPFSTTVVKPAVFVHDFTVLPAAFVTVNASEPAVATALFADVNFTADKNPDVSEAPRVTNPPEPAVVDVNDTFSVAELYEAVTPAADALIFANTEFTESDANTLIDVPLIVKDPAPTDTPESKFGDALNAAAASIAPVRAATADTLNVPPVTKDPEPNDTDNPFATDVVKPAVFVHDFTVLPAAFVTVNASAPAVATPDDTFTAAKNPDVSDPPRVTDPPEPAVVDVNDTLPVAELYEAVTPAADALIFANTAFTESDANTLIDVPLIVNEPDDTVTPALKFAPFRPVPFIALSTCNPDTAADSVTVYSAPPVNLPSPLKARDTPLAIACATPAFLLVNVKSLSNTVPTLFVTSSFESLLPSLMTATVQTSSDAPV